jgi:hypothetical protein
VDNIVFFTAREPIETSGILFVKKHKKQHISLTRRQKRTSAEHNRKRYLPQAFEIYRDSKHRTYDLPAASDICPKLLKYTATRSTAHTTCRPA